MNTKQTVNNKERVIYLRRQHPDWFGADIAFELGISREYVRQILVQAKLSTKRQSPYVHTCPACLEVIDNRRVYCNRDCYKHNKYGVYTCSGCGSEFKRRKSIVKRNILRAQTARKQYRSFCSNMCYRNRFKKIKRTL